MEIPRPEHPRPQFLRETWINLNGLWTYAFDSGKSGLARGLRHAKGFDDSITVPFCPESRLSGVGHTDFIEALWYHRRVEVPEAWTGRRVVLHFGAVDYECAIYIDGAFAGSHVGGQCSFEFDVTELVRPGAAHDLVVAVRDDVRSTVQAVGKQSLSYESQACTYTRVTGIWQTVWLEGVPEGGLAGCRIVADFDGGQFVFSPEFMKTVPGRRFRITVEADGRTVGAATLSAVNGLSAAVLLEVVRPWSPEDPFLYDVVYDVLDSEGVVVDTVRSYAGLRSVHVEGDRVFLNNRPVFLRLVLDQGFYSDGIWTAPSDAALRRDIELAMAAGFNGARLHQKVFEERFHYWADRLGYLTWGESASWGMCWVNYESSRLAYWPSACQFQREWREIVMRDRNHPSIIVWTPTNETWPKEDLDVYRGIVVDLYDLTRALDPTRPVNDCSGYHHVKTDIWSVHLYSKDGESLRMALHPDGAAVSCRNAAIEMGDFNAYRGQPYINDEFGGFMYIPADHATTDEDWGYHGLSLKSGEELCARIDEQVEVMLEDPSVCGYCYTQLTDVEQERNGLYNYDRTPKVGPGKLAAVFGKTKSGE